MTKLQLFFIGVLAIAGCYKPGYDDCAISCASGACPSGLSCVAGMCREPGASGACGGVGDAAPDSEGTPSDAPPNSDPDSDGVVTMNDNCPFVPNRNQANEDGDAFGDACDPCPVDGSMTANLDADGDGVGNGCDPNPNIGGDRIVLFEGFSDPTMLVPGANMSGGWTFANGSIHFDTQTGGAWSFTWPLNPLPPKTTVRSAGRITSAVMGFTYVVGAGTIDGTDAAGGIGTVCILGFDIGGGGNPRVLLAEALQGGQTYGALPAGGFGGTNQFTQMKLATTGGYRCGVMPAQSSFVSSTNATTTSPNSGLWARAATGSFDWVMIVSSP